MRLHRFALFFSVLAVSASFADTVKLKDGTVLEGEITMETSDLLKIRMGGTGTIRETKTLDKATVAEIIKTAPDDIEFEKIQKMVPTPSLVSASRYQSLIQTGPDAFLAKFAGSQHADKVKEIKAQLEEELDKAERGNIKLDGKWYSAQDQIDFEGLIASKKSLFRMKSAFKQGGYGGMIGAMRQFEDLERNHIGTPAFAEAVSAAKKIVPALGNQLTGLRRDVVARN
ncbi:MAG: hypothetical protein AAF226_14470, partial [Verrucomicrobiota bacterium]